MGIGYFVQVPGGVVNRPGRGIHQENIGRSVHTRGQQFRIEEEIAIGRGKVEQLHGQKIRARDQSRNACRQIDCLFGHRARQVSIHRGSRIPGQSCGGILPGDFGSVQIGDKSIIAAHVERERIGRIGGEKRHAHKGGRVAAERNALNVIVDVRAGAGRGGAAVYDYLAEGEHGRFIGIALARAA